MSRDVKAEKEAISGISGMVHLQIFLRLPPSQEYLEMDHSRHREKQVQRP